MSAMNARPRSKLIIGLTGNIACGKSTVAKIVRSLGAYVIDADAVAHQVLEEPSVKAQIVATFGKGVITSRGSVDRSALGAIVFREAHQLRKLEELVHPRVIEIIDEMTRKAEEKVIVVEAIKLLESSLASRCHQIWVVTCPRHVQIERLMEGRGLTYSEAASRVDSQPPQEDKIKAATVVIDGSGTIQHAQEQVIRAWQTLVEPELVRLSESR